MKRNRRYAALLRFEVYPDTQGQFRWALKTRNHRIIADSGEAYRRKRDAHRAIKTIREGLGSGDVETIEVERSPQSD